MNSGRSSGVAIPGLAIPYAPLFGGVSPARCALPFYENAVISEEHA